MKTRTERQRGQGSVEFVVFSILLILAMFLVVQLAWIAVQKWQFSHFAAYSARVWSVQKDDGAEEALLKVQLAAIPRWNLIQRDYVKFMWVSDEGTEDFEGESGVQGVTYTGVTQLLSIYRDQIGETFFDYGGLSDILAYIPVEVPTTGLVRFKSFIPMEKEPEEQPDISNRDNDCDDTPCSSGNGR